MNLYYTKSRIMVNGIEAYLFNTTEHQKFVDNILSSDLVSSLDRQLSQGIEESLRAISCTKPSSKRNKGAKNAGLSAADSEAFVGNDFEQAPGVPAGPAHSHTISVRYPASPIRSIESSVCYSCLKVTEDNVFCTRCESWFHFECEQIHEQARANFGGINHDYTCLTCTYESNCESQDDLMESLGIDSRNEQESNPHLEEETSVKPVFESNLKDSQSCGSTEHSVPLTEPNVNIHGAFAQTALYLNPDPSENRLNKDIQQSPLVGKESGNVSVSPQVREVSALNPHNQSGMEDNGDSGQNSGAGLMGGKALGCGTKSGKKKSEIDDLKLEPKGTKQPRRGSKQKVKENEMEEQLTLARSLISNLERKNGELESSINIMKRQMNFHDPRGASIPQTGSCESQSRHDTSEYQTHIHPAVQRNDRQGPHIQYVPQTDLDQHNTLVHSMNLIRERLNTIEMDCFRNRLHSVELGVQQQRMFHMQSQPLLNAMLMPEAPHNPYIHPYLGCIPRPNFFQQLAGPSYYHLPLQPAFSTMGNGIPVQNFAHCRPHVLPAHHYMAHMGPPVHPAHHYTAHMGPSVYPRQNDVMGMYPQAYIQTRQGAPLVSREGHTHQIPTALNAANGIQNVTRQCSQRRPAPGVHPVPVVHPVPKHTDDVHNHNSIDASKPTGDIHTPSSIEGNRSHDCTMELSRDALQSPDPDVEFVCGTLGPVTATLNQRLPLKQTVVTERNSTCGMKDSDSAGRPTAAARQRDGGNLSDEVVKGPSNTTQDSFLENGRASQKTHTDATQDLILMSGRASEKTAEM